MPTPASQVGALSLPLPPGVLNSPINDPCVSGLGLYFQHWLRYDLNAKLANLQGTSSDVCAHLFFWSSLDPSPTFVRGAQDGQLAIPALYVWGSHGHPIPFTTVYDVEEREVVLLWIFDELSVPGALEDRYGLRNAVAKSIQRAVSLRYHPTFSLNGGPLGQPIAQAVGLTARGIVINRITPGFLAPVPQNVGRDQAADQPNIRAYPSVQVSLTVWERIEPMQPVAGDAQGDVFVNINTVDRWTGTDAPLQTDQRYLLGPDEVDD